MFKAIQVNGTSQSCGADDIVHLTFPVTFQCPEAQPPLREAKTLLRESPAPAFPLPAAVAEMYAGPSPEGAPACQIRVDMTLAEAEDLVEGLRSLIAAAKASLPPTALALAGLKIGAAPRWRRPASTKRT